MNLFDNIVNRPILPQYAQENFCATSSQMQPQPMQQAQPNLFDKYMQDSSISANGRRQCKRIHKKWSNNSRASWQDYHRYLQKDRHRSKQNKNQKERICTKCMRIYMRRCWRCNWTSARALWNIAEFGSKVWQYTPFSLWATAIQVWFSIKHFDNFWEEQKHKQKKPWQIWESWSEFCTKYGAYDPTTVWASLGRTWVEIWASLRRPNKVWAIQSSENSTTPTRLLWRRIGMSKIRYCK